MAASQACSRGEAEAKGTLTCVASSLRRLLLLTVTSLAVAFVICKNRALSLPAHCHAKHVHAINQVDAQLAS